MAGLSRRRFLAATGAASVALGVGVDALRAATGSIARAADVPSTLRQTIRLSSTAVRRSYRTLVSAPGEDYITRLDLLKRAAEPARATSRRSIAYFAHLSDIHIADGETPARLEPLQDLDHALWAGAFRPHDTLTSHVLGAMVESVNAASESPVSGAPMTFAVVTGDSTDMLSALETQWYIDILDGTPVTPGSGSVGTYDGVQVWDGCAYAYHPDNPEGDVFGAYGFPTVPGMLDAAVSTAVETGGLAVPWYSVYGNHDVLYIGTLPVDANLRAWAIGQRKASQAPSLLVNWLQGLASNPSILQRAVDAIVNNVGFMPGIRTVAADSRRRLLERGDFMAAHLASPAMPGPVGHGFTPAHVESGQTWWRADPLPQLRIFGLDTCNPTAGPDGGVPQVQYDWLKSELAALRGTNVLAVVLSHHNSFTMENAAQPGDGPATRWYNAEDLIAMLLDHPQCIAWLNGHTHINTITAHQRDGGGLWEITTASCIDFPQQQQTVEIVDNRDGTLSIFTTTLDHAGDATWTAGDLTSRGMSSLSRELAANDWVENPGMRIGSQYDRNTELLMPAPFDLSTISDATLEEQRVAAKARLMAHGGAQ